MPHRKTQGQSKAGKHGAQARGSTTSYPSPSNMLTFSVCKDQLDREHCISITIASSDKFKQLRDQVLRSASSRQSTDKVSLVWYDKEADKWQRIGDKDPSISIDRLNLPTNCILSIDDGSSQSLAKDPQSPRTNEAESNDYELMLKLCLKPMDAKEVTMMKIHSSSTLGELRERAYEKFHRPSEDGPLFQYQDDQWVRFTANMDQTVLADLPFQSGMFTSLDYPGDNANILVAPGLCGLTNLGSTCYMNSIFQCLSHIPSFAKSILAFSDDIDAPVLEPYIRLMKRMWSGQYQSVNTLNLLDSINDKHPRYTEYRQQDAQEFMSHFLHLIDDELTDGKTLIKKLFYGQLQSTITCRGCQRTETTNESISFLPLSVNNEPQISVLLLKSNGEQNSVALQTDSSVITVGDLIDCFMHQCDIKLDRKTLQPYRLVENAIREPYDRLTPLVRIREEQVALLECPDRAVDEICIWCAFRDESTGESFRPSIAMVVPMKCYYGDIAENINHLCAHLCSITDTSASACYVFWRKYRGGRIRLRSSMHPNESLPNLMTLEINMDTAAAQVYRHYSAAHRASNNSSLDNLLADFFTEHPLHGQYRCSACSQITQAQQLFRLRSPLPPVFIIQLKRFTYDSYSHEKIHTFIPFPLNELNLADFLGTADDGQSRDSSSTVYDLVAVANHMGTVSSGHYTAFGKYHANGQWYCFDDTRVEIVASARDVITKSAYILVYVRRKVE